MSTSVLPVSAATLNTGHMHRAALSSALTGLVPTLTKAFPSGVLRDMGAATATTPMHVTLSLQTRNRAMINTLLSRQNTPGDSMYHVYLTPAQSAQLFSPSAAQVSAVESFLQSAGFTKISATADNELVTASGTVGTVNAAFGSAEHIGLYGTQAIVFNTQGATVPAALGSTVSTVLGLNTLPKTTFLKQQKNARGQVARMSLSAARSKVMARLRKPAAPAARTAMSMKAAQAVAHGAMHANIAGRTSGVDCTPVQNVCVLNDFFPRDFWITYNARGPYAPTNGTSGFDAEFHNGIQTPIAIFAEGDLSTVTTDLRTFENLSSLPLTSYTVTKEPNSDLSDTSGADEFDLDTQTSSSFAGNVKKLNIYDVASLNDSDLVLGFDMFKTADTEKAGSASFGGCESLEGSGVTAFDEIFAEAAIQGQTVFASSGDDGGSCLGASNGVPAGVPGVEYPASSEYVIGVGGTTLLADTADSYVGEITWYSGGGGLSLLETPGAWTTPVSTYSTLGERGVPDISYDADPDSGADVVVAGAVEVIGGTSLSSPMALGAWARIETYHNNAFGFAGPVFYKEFGDATASYPTGQLTGDVAGFKDIILGNNVVFPATQGYDLTTGLGSPDLYKSFIGAGT